MSGYETLGNLLAAAAARDPEGAGVVDADGTSMTWAQLDSRSNQLARGLLHAGLRHGDRVLTVVGERIEYPMIYAALAKAGLVAVPVSWRYKPRELVQIGRDALPAAILYEDAFATTVAAAVAELETMPLLIELGDGSIDDARPLARLIGDESANAIDEAHGNDVAILGYTSGTTGQPKGATFDHHTCRTAAAAAALSYGLPNFGAGILTGSLSYATVTIVHLWSHVLGNSTAVLVGRFDIERMVDLLERHEGTFTYLPTPAIVDAAALLAAHPRALANLRVVLVGASPIPPRELRGLVEVAAERVVQSYGMTEGAGAPVCIGRRSDWESEPEPYTCVGRSVPPGVLGLRDGATTLPHDDETVGELVLRSPLLMGEYWRNPDATAAAIDDGWFHTGDQATISPGGRVNVKGRSKEVIITGGANVYPVEVETVIGESPRIAECAVVGIPDERWGETPVAFVVAAGPADDLEEHVRETCRGALANYKCPTRVVVLDELPRNANNKILKRDLAGLVVGRGP